MAIVTVGGFGEMTPAMQNTVRKAAGVGTARARGRKRSKGSKKKAAAKPAKRAKSRSSKRPARLVKGSAAAKRYMASIRAKRK